MENSRYSQSTSRAEQFCNLGGVRMVTNLLEQCWFCVFAVHKSFSNIIHLVRGSQEPENNQIIICLIRMELLVPAFN